MNVTQNMENWVANLYVVATYDSEEEDDQDNNEDE